MNDICLGLNGNLGIRYNGGRKKRMGLTAAFTSDTADAEFEFTSRSFETAFIVTMDMQTAGTPAGTCELMKLQICDKIIIKIWCNGIAFFYK